MCFGPGESPLPERDGGAENARERMKQSSNAPEGAWFQEVGGTPTGADPDGLDPIPTAEASLPAYREDSLLKCVTQLSSTYSGQRRFDLNYRKLAYRIVGEPRACTTSYRYGILSNYYSLCFSSDQAKTRLGKGGTARPSREFHFDKRRNPGKIP